MLKLLFKDKQKTNQGVAEIIYHMQKDLDLIEAFSYNPKDFNHQVAEFDQQALRFFQKEQPNLTIKQHYFAKYLSQADDFSTNAIANALSLSPRTVADYFMFLKDKFNAKDKISTIIKCREYFELLWE